MAVKCSLCDQPIKKDDKITVVAKSIDCLDDEGGYNILSDFLKAEKIYHANCYEGRKFKFVNPPSPERRELIGGHQSSPSFPLPLSKKVLDILLEMGEQVKIPEVINFIEKHSLKEKDENEIIKVWFENRNELE